MRKLILRVFCFDDYCTPRSMFQIQVQAIAVKILSRAKDVQRAPMKCTFDTLKKRDYALKTPPPLRSLSYFLLNQIIKIHTEH